MVKRVQVPIQKYVGRLVRGEKRVRFQDCDMFQHMNSAAFLGLAINHRFEAVLDAMGFDTYGLTEDTGVAFPIREVHMDFRRSANLDEVLDIESWLDEATRTFMKVVVQVRERDSRELCCVVRLTFAAFNLRKNLLVQVPAELPTDRPEAIEALPWAEGHPRPAAAVP